MKTDLTGSPDQTAIAELVERLRDSSSIAAYIPAFVRDELTAAAAALEVLAHDARRLDWLADRDNALGAVQLPTACIESNLDSLRRAIDAAMALPQEPDA